MSKAINWSALTDQHFGIDQESEFSYPAAIVLYNSKRVELNILGDMRPSASLVCKSLLQQWDHNRSFLTAETQKLVARFLPEKKISFEELDLFRLSVHCSYGEPVYCNFQFCVGGAYEKSRESVKSEFDSDTMLDFVFDINGVEIVFQSLLTTVSNDLCSD